MNPLMNNIMFADKTQDSRRREPQKRRIIYLKTSRESWVLVDQAITSTVLNIITPVQGRWSEGGQESEG